MKRIAALYDIHGNLPALEAVLAEVATRNVDQVVVGGDVVPGPMPLECLALLLAQPMPVAFIQGNGESAVIARQTGVGADLIPEQAHEAVGWVAGELSAADVARFAAWPLVARFELDELGSILFCHATPRNNTEVFTKLTPEERLRPIFEATGAAVVVCGHTHMQFDRRIGRVRVVNAGSVGMPIGEASAHWLLLGPDVEHRRTRYPGGAAGATLRTSGYPGVEAFVERHVFTPPREEDLLPLYEEMALKA
jgi:predicted phosphodiesterase